MITTQKTVFIEIARTPDETVISITDRSTQYDGNYPLETKIMATREYHNPTPASLARTVRLMDNHLDSDQEDIGGGYNPSTNTVTIFAGIFLY
jgi:hypothetical protein